MCVDYSLIVVCVVDEDHDDYLRFLVLLLVFYVVVFVVVNLTIHAISIYRRKQVRAAIDLKVQTTKDTARAAPCTAQFARKKPTAHRAASNRALRELCCAERAAPARESGVAPAF